MVKQNKGFKLIELMIVVAVITFWLQLLIRLIQESVHKTKRIEMQTSLQDIVMTIQKYKIANFKVVGATETNLGIGLPNTRYSSV